MTCPPVRDDRFGDSIIVEIIVVVLWVDHECRCFGVYHAQTGFSDCMLILFLFLFYFLLLLFSGLVYFIVPVENFRS